MFKKMIKAMTSKKKEEEERVINDVSDLRKGDIITFKERSELPNLIQGVDAEVTGFSCYEYRDGSEKELSLKTTGGEVFHLTLVDEDGERYLSLSKPIPRAKVNLFFEEDAFSLIFDEEVFASEVKLIGEPDESFSGWLGESYQQTLKGASGFYHPNTEKPSGRGQEFISHYCEANDGYGLQIEIWEDGDTEVFAICECSEDVIQDLWPSSK